MNQATAEEHRPNLPFTIEPVVASGVFLRLDFNQHLDPDIKPSAADFSLSLPLCEASDGVTIRPIHVELKERETDHGPLTRVILVLSDPLPPVSEMELHYHPNELLMWSNTLGDSIEPFFTHLPVKLSRHEPKGTLSTKLLESLAEKAKKAIPPPPLPPTITNIDGQRISISLNRQLIPHQGVAAGDFRAEVQDHWCTVSAAAIYQPASDEPHEIQLALKETINVNDTVTIGFKAKRYPMTALDGSQVSNFKISAQYLAPGHFKVLQSEEKEKDGESSFETEKFHLQQLEGMLAEPSSRSQVMTGFFESFKDSLMGPVSSGLAVSRLQMFLGLVLLAVILWLVVSGIQLIAGLSSNQPIRALPIDIDMSATRECSLDFPSGNQYTGTCNTANQPHGEGVFRWRSGSTYDGQFENGKRSGLGVMSYANGAKYDGLWQNDKKQGLGIYWNRTGDRFEGKFSQGKMTAEGVCYKHDGTQLLGFCSE